MTRPFEPTAEQRHAILFPLADCCVVAGAGSGKTAVLTRRFVHLALEHGLPVRRIAALTFTDKAAAEMRDRIAAALGSSARPELAEEVEFAPISTIHSFCARLLRAHALEAALDPSFVVLDGTESRLLREEAVQAALRHVHAEEPDVLSVLVETALDAGIVGTLLDRLHGAGLAAAAVSWRAEDLDAPGRKAELEAALADLGREADADPDEGVRARGREALRIVGTALEDDDVWALVASRRVVERVKPAGARKRGRKPLAAARKGVEDLLDLWIRFGLDRLGAARTLPRLRRLLEEIERIYEERKHEQGALDFSDLERRALALLEALGAAGRPVRQAPAALLVDEMQDTNPLQARLLHALRGGACPQFSVGDPKQSIYRFRRADVRVLQEELRRVGEQGRASLAATFRSRPPLVDALNHLTERVFAGGRAGVEAGALRAEGAFRDVGGVDVEMVVVDVGKGGDQAVRREAEARWIARRIQCFVEDGGLRARTETDADGRERPARPFKYGDIAILFRARSHVGLYERALRDLGIPFVTHRGRGFFQADEVVDLIHALRVVHDPADDHAFACFATGPAVGATDEDLLRWFPLGERGQESTGRAWECFAAEAREGAPHAAAWAEVERLRVEAAAGRLGQVVEGVLHGLGLLPVALLAEDGARRAMNLRKIVGIARRLERRGRHDLGDLLRHLSTLRDLEIPEAEAAMGSEEDDVVRLLTVHGAKGLEYGVVFLADVGRKAPAPDHAVALDGEGRVAVKLLHPLEGTGHAPGGLHVLREREKTKQEEEDRRLLYVAMTRAEERLVLSGSSAGRTNKGTAAQFAGWGTMLLEALGEDLLPEGRTVALGTGTVTLTQVEPPTVSAQPPRDVVVSPGVDAEARRVAAALLEKARESVAPLGLTPFVVTVSELLRFSHSPAHFHAEGLEGRDDDGHERAGERARLFDEVHVGKASIDRAALGRALHALLERLPPDEGLLDDDLLREVIEAEFGDLAPKDVGAKLRAMVLRFQASDAGRRMRSLTAEGEDVRREVAFHARIRFPRGSVVGGFEALLVRGAVDLWLPGPEGALVVDYKTNVRSRALPTPDALAAHYAVQMRLYALAAERLLGADVAGARLVLLDASWGKDALDVEVDVGGEALEEARRLCEAYARACLEDRWPKDWRALLGEQPS